MILRVDRWLEAIEVRLEVADDLYGPIPSRFEYKTEVPNKQGDSTE